MTRDELLKPTGYVSTQDQEALDTAWNASKIDTLAKAREDKLFTLKDRVGLLDTDLTRQTVTADGMDLYMDNKIQNDYTPAELNYFMAARNNEAGVFPDVRPGREGQFLTRNGSGELVPYQGDVENDVHSLYTFGAKDNPIDTYEQDTVVGTNKLGISHATDPRVRYTDTTGSNPNVDEFGKVIGPIGVDKDSLKMNLLFQGDENALFEGLRHYANAENAKYKNMEGPNDQEYWKGKRDDQFGSGFSEAYEGGLTGLFGNDAANPLPADIQERYKEFKQKYGLADVVKPDTTQVDTDAFLKGREGYKDTVYADTLGNLTAGYGHKLTEEEKAKYTVGQAIPKEQLEEWYKQDASKAKEAAVKQLKELNLPKDALPVLTSMNYQLGVNWQDKFAGTSKEIAAGNYEGAIERIKNSEWMQQTPERANDAIAMLQAKGYVKLAGADSTEGLTFEQKVEKARNERIAQEVKDYQGLTGFDKFLAEMNQIGRAVAPAAVKGGLDLLDAGQELVTLPVQAVMNKAYGTDIDIDLFDDELKGAMIKAAQEFSGYKQYLDDADSALMQENLGKSGAKFWNPMTWGRLLTTQAGRDAVTTALSNPSMTMYEAGQILGAGGVGGVLAKGVMKLGSKVAPKVAKYMDDLTTTNKEVIRNELKAAQAAGKSADDLAAIKGKYTFGKKVTDGIKAVTLGTTMSNSDFAIRMNEDITAFRENNGGASPDIDKLFAIGTVNRVLSSAEIGSLKYSAKIGELPADVVREGLGNALKDAAKHIAGGMVTETAQEMLDSIGQQINQKVGSEKYKDYTVGQILEEANAEILAGTLTGTAMGAHISTGREVLDRFKPAVAGTMKVVNTGLEAVSNVKESIQTMRADVKDAFGGDEVVTNTLNGVGQTREARREIVTPVVEQMTADKIAHAENIVTQIRDDAGLEPGQPLTAAVVEKLVQGMHRDLMMEDNGQGGLREVADPELKKKNAILAVNALADLSNSLTDGGKVEEARMITSAIASNFQKYAMDFGTSPEALSHFTEQVVQAAVRTGVINDEGVGAIQQIVTKLARKQGQTDVQIEDMHNVIATAVAVGNSYKKLAEGERTLQNVGADVAIGGRGFLGYYQGYKEAVEAGNLPNAIILKDQLDGFKGLQEVKLATLVGVADSIGKEIEAEIGAAQSENRGSDLSYLDLRSRLFGKFGNKEKETTYGTGSKEKFKVKYNDVIDYKLAAMFGTEIEPKGVYKVIETVAEETEAMGTLLGYIDNKLVKAKSTAQTAQASQTTQVDQTVPPAEAVYMDEFGIMASPNNAEVDSSVQSAAQTATAVGNVPPKSSTSPTVNVDEYGAADPSSISPETNPEKEQMFNALMPGGNTQTAEPVDSTLSDDQFEAPVKKGTKTTQSVDEFGDIGNSKEQGTTPSNQGEANALLTVEDLNTDEIPDMGDVPLDDYINMGELPEGYNEADVELSMPLTDKELVNMNFVDDGESEAVSKTQNKQEEAKEPTTASKVQEKLKAAKEAAKAKKEAEKKAWDDLPKELKRSLMARGEFAEINDIMGLIQNMADTALNAYLLAEASPENKMSGDPSVIKPNVSVDAESTMELSDYVLKQINTFKKGCNK